MDNNKVMYGALITEIDKLGDKHSRNNEPKEWLEMQISKKCNKTKQISTDEVGSCQGNATADGPSLSTYRVERWRYYKAQKHTK
jgi:hypothetical protein